MGRPHLNLLSAVVPPRCTTFEQGDASEGVEWIRVAWGRPDRTMELTGLRREGHGIDCIWLPRTRERCRLYLPTFS